MRLFEAAGFNSDELQHLNRVRIYQQVLFLSCVLGASGKTLDKRYLKRCPEGERWSTIKFSKENPPRKDFKLWAKALQQIIPAEGILDRLGRFQHEGYKIWSWRYDVPSNRLLRLDENEMDVYRPAQGRATRSATKWELSEENVPLETAGRVCTVRDAENGKKVIVSAEHANDDISGAGRLGLHLDVEVNLPFWR